MNVMVRRLYTVVNGMPKPLVLIAGIAMIGVLGTVDLLTKNEILFSAFYILPITLIAWFAGGRSAAIVSVLSVSFLFADDISSRLMSLDSVAVYWNNFGRLVFFLIISYLLASLKKAFDRQQALARIDSLTELRNSRAFYEDAGMEIERAKRYKYPLTLGFIDLDDLKFINDTYGHAAGDAVIKQAAHSIQDSLRNIDISARMGGDEFIILLTRAEKQEALDIVARIGQKLAEKMKESRRALTMSVGLFACRDMCGSLDSMIAGADKLMYAVKSKGKNGVLFEEQ